MNLTEACRKILTQLSELVLRISDEHFSKPVAALGGSTIGQHLRHTLEFFICFRNGFDQGVINYDKRGHDKLIESRKEIALQAIHDLNHFISTFPANCQLKLEVSYNPDEDHFVTIDTNAFRELVYNIEHAVHHMAIMKIGIREVAPYLTLPPDFGIAASTIRHREREQVPS